MFPRPIATHRGNPGAFSGITSAGQVYESYTGKIYAVPFITYDSTDVDDSVSYEIFNNPTWSASSLAAIQATTYYSGANYRFRLTNSYFGSNSAYVTGSAATNTRIGGATSQIITANSIELNTSGSWDIVKRYNFRVNVPKELVSSLSVFEKDIEVGMSFLVSGVTVTQFQTFTTWPDDSSGSTVTSSNWTLETITPSSGGSHYVVEVRWAAEGPPSVWYQNLINYRIKYVDSGGINTNWTNFLMNYTY